MSEVLLEYYWDDYDPPWQRFKPGRWGVGFSGDPTVGQLGIFVGTGLDYRLEHFDHAIDTVRRCLVGRDGPGWVLGDSDGGVAFGGGYFLFASGYDDESRVVVEADVFLKVLERVRALITNPGFTDPNASFETMVVPIVATGPEPMEIYCSLGGSTDNAER